MAGESEIVRALLWLGEVDWVSLHDVVWYGTRGVLSAESKDRTIEVLDLMFREGLMVPGELGESGFEDWPEPTEWKARALRELERLEWAPMGDGFWLRLTPRGEAQAPCANPVLD